jgi:hypothetical protein
MIKALKLGETGYFVTQWQMFLRGQNYFIDASGIFDDKTKVATLSFQREHQLDPDGIVGNQTLGRAALLGFELVEYSGLESAFPSKPNFPPLLNISDKQELFGLLEFVAAPTASNPEAIKITNNWERSNVIQVKLPQLIGIPGATQDGHLWFHKKAAAQLTALWAAWETADLIEKILSFDGAFNPRFIRGHAHDQILSNHAFATAFDINYAWNNLGAEPATYGTKGCVYDLVSIANQHGFYWGGHFTRKDGMHFEVAKII